MSSSTHIEAVTVNHNSSLFAELMLRSLGRCENPSMAITVMDNASVEDEEKRSLLSYAESRSIRVLQSGYDTATRHINSHGEVLRDFVLARPDCSHYLIVDPDIYFPDEKVIMVMLKKLRATPLAFAVVPRVACTEDRQTSAVDNKKSIQECEMKYTMKWQNGTQAPLAKSRAFLSQRLHPFCALIKNSVIFRSVVKELGLSNAWTFEVNGGIHWDTLGLMTAVMKTHGFDYVRSPVRALHFAGVSHNATGLVEKRIRCKKLIRDLRG